MLGGVPKSDDFNHADIASKFAQSADVMEIACFREILVVIRKIRDLRSAFGRQLNFNLFELKSVGERENKTVLRLPRVVLKLGCSDDVRQSLPRHATFRLLIILDAPPEEFSLQW